MSLLFATLALAAAGCGVAVSDSEEPSRKAKADEDGMAIQASDVATLGGGCFWCIEAVFERVEGVAKVVSGFAGGHVPDPSYKEVVSGETGHAEVVQVHFDPDVLPYRELLEIFFAMHDPTTLNRQGADVGTQYRSVVFHHSPEQEKVVREVIEDLTRQKIFDDPIVTQVEPFEDFYEAEAYHQEYYDRNPNQGYCRVVISPKLAKLRQKYADRLKGGGE
jgi:peptide-methionine (S)-S-oxide reductase